MWCTTMLCFDPILLLIFINDLPNATDCFKILFADDTTFQVSGHNHDQLFDVAKRRFQKKKS